MSIKQLEAGDEVFHPVYGFGVVEGRTTRDQAGQATDYYGVRLSEGGVLSVPVARAETLGLRRVVNSLSAIVRCLRSPASSLPDNDRQRILELKARWQSPQPMALIEAVRDLSARSHTRTLTPADKKWLTSACERLIGEAARVDAIDPVEARAVIQAEVDRLKSH
jgi:RNA polymerase-interacting CarD/CdnL/TRCF family regulator